MYDKIRSPIESDFAAVNAFVISQLYSEVDLVENIGQYIVDAGGKRMRPIVTLLSARSCGFQGGDHIKLAAVIEFIHTATLLHDDVVDMSTMRRGRPTANSRWNNPSSVLVGDFIYSRAFQILVSLNNQDIMAVMADTTNKIAEGEVLQLINQHNPEITEEGYLRVIRHKTAILFQAAASTGAIMAGTDAETIAAMGNYGLHVGNAFQLIDDVLDYSGKSDLLGKNIGDDLAEGKPTLPLIYSMEHSSPEESNLIKDALTNGGIDSLNKIIDIVTSSGGLAYTRQMALDEADKAKSCLAGLPPTEFRDSLSSLADFAVQRIN